MSAAQTLPLALLAEVFARLPQRERVAVAQTCRAWRAASAMPSAAWRELQVCCGSLEQWMAVMRWLRPRVAAMQRLHLALRARVRATRSRCRARCEAALHALADRLAAAGALQELHLDWGVEQHSCSVGKDGAAAAASTLPLSVDLLLPGQSRTARRRRRPLTLGLRQLELACEAGVVLGPQLGLLHSLERLTLGRGWAPQEDGSCLGGPVVVAAGCGGLPVCLPRSLTALCLSSHRAVDSLAGMGSSLAAGLPGLRELRMPVSDSLLEEATLSTLSGWTSRLLQALLPLAGQLQVLELPPRSLPLAAASFTALQTLVVCKPPVEGAQAAWDSLLFSLGRLRSVDVSLIHPLLDGDASQFTLPLSLAALPEGLTHLRLHIRPATDLSLPAGDYLRRLRSLDLGPLASLRLTPLLPFMPELRQLTVRGDPEWDDVPQVRHPRLPTGGGCGDAAMDAAAAAAAAMPLGSDGEQRAAAGQLAVGLARHTRFRRLCCEADRCLCVSAIACTLALRLVCLSSRAQVDIPVMKV